MPATSSRCRQLALALWGSALGSRPPSRPPSRPLPLGRAPSARGTHTRTPIYATRAAHKGLIPPLCAAPCFLIPSLVCDMGRGGPARAGAPGPRRRALPVLTAAGADGYWCRWALSAPRAVGHYRRRALSGAATPTRVVGMSARCPHRRALYPPRGVDNPLAAPITPSRCRRHPPRGADNARPHSHHRGSTAAVEAPVLRVAHTRTPIYETCAAHKGLIPALACGAVLPNSLPCVRHGPGQADACCRAGALSPGRRMLRALTGAVGAVGRCYADAAGPGARCNGCARTVG